MGKYHDMPHSIVKHNEGIGDAIDHPTNFNVMHFIGGFGVWLRSLASSFRINFVRRW